MRSVIFSATWVALKAVLSWTLVPLFSAPRRSRFGWLVLLPWVLPSSIGSLAWLWFFYDIGGWRKPIPLTNRSIVSPHSWFGNPHSAFWLIIAFNVWRETPLWAIALASGVFIPENSLTSLAATDGLNARARLRLLVIPRIKPSLEISPIPVIATGIASLLLVKHLQTLAPVCLLLIVDLAQIQAPCAARCVLPRLAGSPLR
jgi:ABC-type sugar transport system permease subunit